MRSKLLLGTAASALLALAGAANATLMVTATDNGTALVFTPTVTGPGILDGTFADPNFSSVSVSISGVPAIPSPDLGTVTLQVSGSTGAGHTIDLTATQTGLTQPAGFNGALTQTFNNLIGGPGPATETFGINGGTTVAHTFPTLPLGSDVNNVNLPGLPAISSNFEEFKVQFTAAGQDAEMTQEFVAAVVPEPASLAILGSALTMLGLLGWRRRDG